MTLSDLLAALTGLGAPPLGAWFWQTMRRGRGWRRRSSFFSDWFWIAGVDALYGAIFGTSQYAACSGVSFALALVIRWWWRRKDRKRALKMLGAKSRARIADLVASLRESLRPRPVLKPQPGGAPG